MTDQDASVLTEQEAWIAVAVESNRALDAYCRELFPGLPEHYGMPVDGVRLTIEHLMSKERSA